MSGQVSCLPSLGRALLGDQSLYINVFRPGADTGGWVALAPNGETSLACLSCLSTPRAPVAWTCCGARVVTIRAVVAQHRATWSCTRSRRIESCSFSGAASWRAGPTWRQTPSSRAGRACLRARGSSSCAPTPQTVYACETASPSFRPLLPASPPCHYPSGLQEAANRKLMALLART